MIKYKSSL